MTPSLASAPIPPGTGEGSGKTIWVNADPAQVAEMLLELKGQRFSLADRPYIRHFYAVGGRPILIRAGRQVEKSVSTAARQIVCAATIPYFQCLSVLRSHAQTSEFSRSTLGPFLESPQLRAHFYDPRIETNNIMKKTFLNGSTITLRSARHNADRVRGCSAGMVTIDEIQDMLGDNIPVINECMAHADTKWKTYAGTPKTSASPMETYWNWSTQCEWVVPCAGCRTENVLGEPNIGPAGLLCAKCGKAITARAGRWMAMHPTADWMGYRLPQLMVPWLQWPDLLQKQREYSTQRFWNECLALPYDLGTKPITLAELRGACRSYRFPVPPSSRPKFLGIDWGGGEHSYTVAALLEEEAPARLRLVWAHRFRGREAEPNRLYEFLMQKIQAYDVTLTCADFGFGWGINARFIAGLPTNRFVPVQLAGPATVDLKVDRKKRKVVANRQLTLADIFEALKAQEIVLPPWEDIQDLAQDILNVTLEQNTAMTHYYYDHPPDRPDDFLHAINFAVIAWRIATNRIRRRRRSG